MASASPIPWASFIQKGGDDGFSGWMGGGGGAKSGISGSNQFFPVMPSIPTPFNANPGMATMNTPGVVPPSSGGGSGTFPGGTQPLQFTGPPGASGQTGIGKGLFAQNPLDPALTSQFFQFLQSQIGKGVDPFNLSTLLPSSGQATTPGQLNAPLTDLLKEIQGAFGPGGQIGDIATKGVSAVPQWQTMVDAMQRQIGQGAANLKEQFNFAGDLASSPFGTAAADYQLQSNKDLNSLLAQLQQQNFGLQLQAGQEVEGAGQFMQGLDQQAIQNLLQEFIRTSPQYNPTLGMEFGASTTFPPVLNPKTGAGGLGALLGGSGQLAGGIAALIPAIAALCWIARAIYGETDLRSGLIRALLLGSFGKTERGLKLVSWYLNNGERLAAEAKKSPSMKIHLKSIFDRLLKEATSGKWELRYA